MKGCFLCGHALFPGDKVDGVPISGIPICGICRVSLPGDELLKAVDRRTNQYFAEYESRSKAWRDALPKKDEQMNDFQNDFAAACVTVCNYFGFIALMNMITLELIRGWFGIDFLKGK